MSRADHHGRAGRAGLTRTTLFRRRFTRAGAPPGEYVAHEGAGKPAIHVISYNAADLEEHRPTAIEQIRDILAADRAAGRITWIDIQGLGDARLLEALREALDIHHLALADTINTGQRPKIDDYGDSLYGVVRMASLTDHHIEWEQVSLFVRAGVLLTVQERRGDCLDPLRQRLRQSKKTLRSSGADYLAVMVVDAIVDGYFPVLDTYGEWLEDLETRVVRDPTQDTLSEIYRAKRELLEFRRSVWPLRDTLSQLLRSEHELLAPHVLPYLRDTLDHVMQVIDVVETYREMAASFVDVYLSSISNRTNEIVRVLTLLAAIFVPITFLAGVYGMNFDHFPELHYRYGYLAFWLVAIVIALGMTTLFWRLGWVGSRRRIAARDSERPKDDRPPS